MTDIRAMSQLSQHVTLPQQWTTTRDNEGRQLGRTTKMKDDDNNEGGRWWEATTTREEDDDVDVDNGCWRRGKRRMMTTGVDNKGRGRLWGWRRWRWQQVSTTREIPLQGLNIFVCFFIFIFYISNYYILVIYAWTTTTDTEDESGRRGGPTTTITPQGLENVEPLAFVFSFLFLYFTNIYR